MLDHYVVICVKAPAGGPSRKVIFKMEPGDTLEFRSLIGKSGLESSVVVSEWPDEFGFPGEFLNLTERGFARFQLLYDGGRLVPAYAGETGDTGPVKRITIANHGNGPKLFDEPQQPLEGGSPDSGPEVGIREHDHMAVIYAQ
jgi:hypothetical protein